MSTPTPLYIALLLVVPAVQLPLASFFGLDLAFIPPLAISSVQFFAASFMLYYIKKPIIAAVCNLAGTDELSTMSAQWTADNFQFGWTLLGYIGILLSKKVDPWTENQRGGTISGLVVGAVFVLVAINISNHESYDARRKTLSPAPSVTQSDAQGKDPETTSA